MTQLARFINFKLVFWIIILGNAKWGTGEEKKTTQTAPFLAKINKTSFFYNSIEFIISFLAFSWSYSNFFLKKMMTHIRNMWLILAILKINRWCFIIIKTYKFFISSAVFFLIEITFSRNFRLFCKHGHLLFVLTSWHYSKLRRHKTQLIKLNL